MCSIVMDDVPVGEVKASSYGACKLCSIVMDDVPVGGVKNSSYGACKLCGIVMDDVPVGGVKDSPYGDSGPYSVVTNYTSTKLRGLVELSRIRENSAKSQFLHIINGGSSFPIPFKFVWNKSLVSF